MNQNQLHTTGPWEFIQGAIVGPKIDDKPVWLRPVVARLETGVSNANARLIAAAPELLEACLYIDSLDPHESPTGEWNEAFKKVAAAITKATGANHE